MFTVNKSPSPRDLLNFGWAMLTGFGAIGVLFWLAAWRSSEGASLTMWMGSGRQIAAVVLWAVGISLCVVSHVSAPITKAVYVTWMTAAIPIGVFMSALLLSALFVCLLPWFALIVRSGDPLRKKILVGKSYWESYQPHEPTLDRARRPF